MQQEHSPVMRACHHIVKPARLGGNIAAVLSARAAGKANCNSLGALADCNNNYPRLLNSWKAILLS
jgi:hypothetical protein